MDIHDEEHDAYSCVVRQLRSIRTPKIYSQMTSDVKAYFYIHYKFTNSILRKMNKQ